MKAILTEIIELENKINNKKDYFPNTFFELTSPEQLLYNNFCGKYNELQTEINDINLDKKIARELELRENF